MLLKKYSIKTTIESFKKEYFLLPTQNSKLVFVFENLRKNVFLFPHKIQSLCLCLKMNLGSKLIDLKMMRVKVVLLRFKGKIVNEGK